MKFGEDQILNRFRTAKSGLLVATDVAARGLDFTDINLVINFDIPGDVESYVHRNQRNHINKNDLTNFRQEIYYTFQFSYSEKYKILKAFCFIKNISRLCEKI